MDAKSKAIGALAFALLNYDQQLAAYSTLKVVDTRYGPHLPAEEREHLQENIQLAETLLGIKDEENK